jgi:hypothetical protein
MLACFARAECAASHIGWMRCRLAIVCCAVALLASMDAARAGEPLSLAFAACECASAKAPSECASTSANFTVQSFVNGPNADDVARHCERVCTRLRGEVFSIAAGTRWQPKCKVALHPTRDAYRRAVGVGASQTVGSSSVSFSGGRITKRRIDLLAADSEQSLAALPHAVRRRVPNHCPAEVGRRGTCIIHGFR